MASLYFQLRPLSWIIFIFIYIHLISRGQGGGKYLVVSNYLRNHITSFNLHCHHSGPIYLRSLTCTIEIAANWSLNHTALSVLKSVLHGASRVIFLKHNSEHVSPQVETLKCFPIDFTMKSKLLHTV